MAGRHSAPRESDGSKILKSKGVDLTKDGASPENIYAHKQQQ